MPIQSLGWEDSMEEEMAIQLQFSCLESPMDGGVWRATVHRVEKCQTQLSN